MANVIDEQVREFLSDVPVDQTRTLLHLLTCNSCRAYAEAVLREQLAADEGNAPPQRSYDRVFAAMELKTPGLIRRLHAQRSAAEHLLADFLSRPERARWWATRSERFHDMRLVDLLLELSHETQLKEPLQAAILARLANALVTEMAPEKVTDREVHRVHAYALAGNGLRLSGRLKAAASALRESSSSLRNAANSYERGFLCRYLGILRWEQELIAEGLAFLDHAAVCFRDSGTAHEVGTCRALQGLLLLEDRQTESARPYLRLAFRGLDPEMQIGLGVRSFLGAALCEAAAGEKRAASSLLQQAWQLFPSLKDDPAEMVRAHWLEGRVKARLKDGEALELLGSVRRELFERRWLFEATAATGDMAIVLGASRRLAEVDALCADTTACLGAFKGARAVVKPLRDLAEVAAAGGDLGVWEAGITSWIRDIFLFYGSRPQPVPFA
jgi:tetratricopeptide (TPR) repeat protein